MQDVQLIPYLAKGVLLASRIAGMVMLVPWWGAGAIPARIKLVLVLVLTVAMFPVAGDVDVGNVAAAVVTGIPVELLVGLALGLSVNVVMAGLASAGRVLSMQIGLRMANVLDPVGGYQSSVVDAALQGICILAILASGLHHVVLRGMAATLRVIPLGAGLAGTSIEQLATSGGRAVFVLLVQVAGPVIAVALAMHVAFAVLLRFAPQMNVFFVAFALVILTGIAMLAGMLPAIANTTMNTLEAQVAGTVRLMGG